MPKVKISRAFRAGTGVLAAAAMSITLVPGPAAGEAAPVSAKRRADDGASIVKETWVNPSAVDLTIRSPAVGATVINRVLLPKGWRRDATRTWPTIYLYPGGGGLDDHTVWAQKTGLVELAAKWNSIVVLPYAAANGGFVNWFNYGKGGTPKWETYHTAELTQLIERNLRANDKRAAIGVSASALGVLSYAGRRPGLFKYVAAFSGIVHMRKPGIPSILMMLNVGKIDPFRLWGIPRADDANWKAHDPYELAPKLRGTGLYLSSGTTGAPGPLDPKNVPIEDIPGSYIVGGVSEFVCGDTSRSLAQRFQQLGIPATVNLYGDGWHAWPYWNRELYKAWPLAMKAIGATQIIAAKKAGGGKAA